MKFIADYVLDINEEICGAKEYAEKYLYCKSQGNSMRSKLYYEMATDELKHAKYIHDIAVEEIEKLKSVYKPTSDMEEMWEKTHREYVEQAAWIRQMLAM